MTALGKLCLVTPVDHALRGGEHHRISGCSGSLSAVLGLTNVCSVPLICVHVGAPAVKVSSSVYAVVKRARDRRDDDIHRHVAGMSHVLVIQLER